MGRWGRGRALRRYTVEECYVLSMSAALKGGIIVPGKSRSGVLTCGSASVALEFVSDALDDIHATLKVIYPLENRSVDQWIYLATTRPHFGGRRWWFKCPATGCRASKLYIPPNEFMFASREAYDLTYRGCQTSGTRLGVFRRELRRKGREWRLAQ